MITNPRFVNIYVGDQDTALDFYTNVLGFAKVEDSPMGDEPGARRWIEVKPPMGDTYFVLMTPDGFEDRIGSFGPTWFDCDDLDKTYEELKAKGVAFPQPPADAPWGGPGERWAQFADPDGNLYGLSQRA